MAIKPNLSNVVVPDVKEELSVLNKIAGILPTERERIEKADIQAKERIQLKQEALKLFAESEKGFTFLDQKVGLAERLGLNDLADAFRDKYDIEESKTEREILQDMQTAEDWREIVSGYERIKKNEDGFYFDSIDKVAGDAMKRFQNLDFINALNVQKKAKSDERTRVQDLADEAAASIEKFDNAILKGQPTNIGEEDKKLLIEDLNRYSERLLLLESDINNLDIQIKNPVIAGLNILNQERGQRRVEFQRQIGTNKMDSMMETDAGPVVKSEDDLIQDIVDLEIGQDDVFEIDSDKTEEVPPLVDRTDEGNIQLTLPTISDIGERISDLYSGAVKPLYESQIKQKEELINSQFITDVAKEKLREEIENIKKLLEQ